MYALRADWDRHQHAAGRDVEDLFTVTVPAGPVLRPPNAAEAIPRNHYLGSGGGWSGLNRSITATEQSARENRGS